MNGAPLPLTAPLLAALGGTLLAALFTCADVALTSLSHARLEALAREASNRYAPQLERAAAKRHVVHARYLFGRVLAMALSLGGYGLWLGQLGQLGHTMTLRALLAVGGLLVLGIMVEAAASAGRRGADWLVPPMLLLLRPFEIGLAPAATITQAASRLVTAPLKGRNDADPKITETEVEIMVEQGEKSGTIEHDPAEMIRNVLEFTELTARDAMVPRTKLVVIKLDTPFDEVVRMVTESGHSRFPVYREEIDDVFGLLYAKDLFRVMKSSWLPPPPSSGDGETPSLRAARLLDIVRQPIHIVPESQPLSSLLSDMRAQRQHLAVVVDEFGDVAGIVTLEDILEWIVGDIQDESDAEEAPIVELGDGRLLADASVLIDDLSAYLAVELDPDDEHDSLGGMLTAKLGRVPERGAAVEMAGFRFVVSHADEKRILKVEIERPKPEEQPEESGETGDEPASSGRVKRGLRAAEG